MSGIKNIDIPKLLTKMNGNICVTKLTSHTLLWAWLS